VRRERVEENFLMKNFDEQKPENKKLKINLKNNNMK